MKIVPAHIAAGPARLSEIEETNVVRPTAAKGSHLWLWFVTAFIIQGVAWATWVVIASHHKVQEVPLVTSAPPAPSK